ncbi:DedA family protein [Streptomyces sp. WM6378]|uniref:DedA family protein n=1 Tax=Streptomyces sp. WM6378 TaxID=1415557 RepID=UPI003B641289
MFFARMVPVFRSLISIPAGIERMPLTVFVGLTALGSLVWNTVFVMAGFWLGDNWRLVEDYGGIVSKGVGAAIVLLVGYFVVSRLPRSRGRHGA